jgi:hypothetical protein
MPKGIEYSEEIVASICAEIASGKSLRKVCEMDGMPSRAAFHLWMNQHSHVFDQYTRARELRADARADRIDDLTDKVESGQLDPNAARVIIDAEKWQAGKENSKRYGDRINVDGNLGVTLNETQLESRVAFLLGKAGIAAIAGGAGAAQGEAEAVHALPGDGASQA